MCTVTLTLNPKDKKAFFLTSNRDEAVLRETLEPDFYTEKGIKMLFPKDVLAGGTWIGISAQKRAICLLNGGFKSHKRKPPYRKSRGLVVLDFLAAGNLYEEIQLYNLEDIEPFTCVIVEWKEKLQFYELVWDGKQRHLKELPLESHIWSSSLLYSEKIKRKREIDFEKLRKEGHLTARKLLKFHNSEKDDNDEETLIINRGFLKTVSITQIVKDEDEVSMKYQNLLEPEKQGIELYF
ncbi:MAG TPA: NRDE family protein [Salinimicrobium sp.]|nr:NRDE family protein [Salinimicrobium sp.]